MARIILYLTLATVLLSCEDDNRDTNHLLGQWRVISREEIATGVVTGFPDTIDSKVLLNLTNDTLQLIGCERVLGESRYSIVGDKIYVESFSIIEPCAVYEWIEITHKSVSLAQSYSLNNGKLQLNSSSQGRFHLVLSIE